MLLIAFFIITTIQQIQTSPQYALIVNSQSVSMYSSQTINSTFEYPQPIFDCSPRLFSFLQTLSQYQQNTPYQLQINNNYQNLTIQITTQYGSFNPTLSSNICQQNKCLIQINNNCPTHLSNSNYFDILHLTISPVATFSYTVNCNIEFNETQIDFGMLVIIIVCTIILSFSTIFSRFDSFNGSGLTFNIWWIILVSVSVLVIGMMSIFFPKITTIIMDVVSWISTIFCVSIVFIEILYNCIKKDVMRKRLYISSKIGIRMVQVLGVLLSLPVVLGWWFSNKNWIISDFISICIIVSILKVFKLISYKMALVAYITMIALYSIGNIVIAIVFRQSFNQYLLFQVNNPYQLQIPVLTRQFNSKCVWISITSVSFPGLFVCFLHRFDKSRNTHIYYISAISSYFIGSVIWWIANTLSYYPLPFDAFCEPIMMIFLTLFARRRKELRTLWEGKFYDEQYLNQKQAQELNTLSLAEKPFPDTFKGAAIKDLFLNINQDSQMHASENADVKNPLDDML